MEKRFVGFLLLSMLVMLGYGYVRHLMLPPPKVAQLPLDGVQDPALPDAEARPVEPAEAQQPADDPLPDAAPPRELAAAPPRPDHVSQQWVTLGSVDPDSPYRMLVTLTNRGASIERVELSSTEYRDLEDRSGYLGHLALTDNQDGGARVNVVGAGTPAAQAQPTTGDTGPGLKAGDVVTALDGQDVFSAAELIRLLQNTRPNREIELSVRRTSNGQPKNLRFKVALGRRPMEVIRPEPLEPDPEHPQHPLSFLLSLDQVGDRAVRFGQDEIPGLPSLRDVNWETKLVDTPEGPAVEFRHLLDAAALEEIGESGSIEVIKRYHLPDVPPTDIQNAAFKAYHLTFEIELRNHGASPQTLAFQLDGPTGLPLEGWWYSFKTHPRSFGGAGARDVIWKEVNGRHEMFTNPVILKQSEKDPKDPFTPMFAAGEHPYMEYVGVDARYFNAALLVDLPDGSQDNSDDARHYAFREALAMPVAEPDELKKSRTDVSFRLISEPKVIPAGGALKERFYIFAGPKQPDLLAQYGLQDTIVYGWFGFVSRPMVWLLHFFYGIVRNYGLAIVLLTVLVRGCMFPLGRKQAMSAQKMQELAPEMKKIADKYKENMEKRSEAQRELFRKHNYNPFSGCLLVFFQLPIFIGLYRGLSVDIELRQAPLIPGISWCSNLAGPDKLFYWEPYLPAFLAGPTGWLGPYLNILPLISVALFLVHQKLFTPPATDEQQQMQQQMMKFMTLFIGVLFFKVPAGLCIYFITSSLWGVAERKLLPKPKKKSEEPPAKPAALPAATTSSNGSSKNSPRAKKKQRRR